MIGGLALGGGDEILTSDEEHPGLLGALGAARELHGVAIREVPLAEIAEAVGPRTRLVACSHVGWMSGSLAPAELAELDVPVLLDGAQGVGAVPVDVKALGCDAYAGAGQKWLCGPDGPGMLYVTPELRASASPSRGAATPTSRTPTAASQASLHEDARRLETLSLSAETVACALAAIELLEAVGWSELHERARTLATRLAERAAPSAAAPSRRASESTLVSFDERRPGGRARAARRARV